MMIAAPGRKANNHNIKNQNVNSKNEEALRAVIQTDPSTSVGMTPDREAGEHIPGTGSGQHEVPYRHVDIRICEVTE
jgi:hypothetical protein